MSKLESSLGWLCNAWNQADAENTSEGWTRVQDVIYGARQAIIWANTDGMPVDQYMWIFELEDAFSTLAWVAHERNLDCIYQRGIRAARSMEAAA